MPVSILGVIFDYGSTLMDFQADARMVDPLAKRALAHSLQTDGVPIEEADFIRDFGAALEANDKRRIRELKEIPTEAVLTEVLKNTGLVNIAPATIRRAMECFYAEYETHWRLYPESKDVLIGLRAQKKRIGMITNAGDAGNIRRLLARHGITNFFDPIIVTSLEGVRKPDPRLFQKVIAAWQLSASKVVMVGDQLGMDIQGAQTVGMRSIWMRTETEMPANKADRGKIVADAEADSIGEIPAILRRWEAMERASF
jgi:HAD superfamily hydrolase (TIGR01662 family)